MCWAQLEQVNPKDAEEVPMRPEHMEETGAKEIVSSGELGPSQTRLPPTEDWGMDKVKCDECGKSVSKKHLLNHKRVVHRGETPYKCLVEDCGVRFASTRRLSDHKRVNHGYPKLRCKVKGCDSEFLFRSQFDYHSRTHQSLKTECEECGESVTASYLSTHIKLVHRGGNPFACKEKDCKMGFSRSEGLADHRRIAHGYPKLNCKVEGCGLEFSRYYEHRNHQRTHMRGVCPEDRPFGHLDVILPSVTTGTLKKSHQS